MACRWFEIDAGTDRGVSSNIGGALPCLSFSDSEGGARLPCDYAAALVCRIRRRRTLYCSYGYVFPAASGETSRTGCLKRTQEVLCGPNLYTPDRCRR